MRLSIVFTHIYIDFANCSSKDRAQKLYTRIALLVSSIVSINTLGLIPASYNSWLVLHGLSVIFTVQCLCIL